MLYFLIQGSGVELPLFGEKKKKKKNTILFKTRSNTMNNNHGTKAIQECDAKSIQPTIRHVG